MGTIQAIVILIAVTRVTVWSKQGFCSKPAVFLATKDHVLSGHAIFTNQVSSLRDCHALCTQHPRCLSYNYQYESTSARHVCQISDATAKMCPHKMKNEEGFKYYEDWDATGGRGCPPPDSDNSNFQFSFPSKTVSDYVRFDRLSSLPPLTAFTLCLWIKVGDQSGDRTLFSYSLPNEDNEILVYNYASLKLMVNDNKRETDRAVNDNHWHHICATWENTAGSWNFYIDGECVVSGDNLKTGHVIKNNGIVILGQDQDNYGGGFKQDESFIGEMYGVNMWNKVSSFEEISRMSKNCSDGIGNYLMWSDFVTGLHGDVLIVTPTTCLPGTRVMPTGTG